MKLITLLFLLIFPIKMLYAHPHMFVDVQPYLEKIDKEKNEVKIHNKWYFDEFSSAGFYMDYDQNQNQKLDKKEIKQIEKDFKKGLKKYKYFLTIKLNSKKVSPEVQNFKIHTKKETKKKGQSMGSLISNENAEKETTVNIVYYEFDIIIPGKITNKSKLEISYYDETIFSVLYPRKKVIPKNNITLTSNKLTKNKCLFEIGF
ncbi:MAG: DUF1007 family protein [bacterium]